MNMGNASDILLSHTMAPIQRITHPREDDIYQSTFKERWKAYYVELKASNPLNDKGQPLADVAIRKRAARYCWKNEEDEDVKVKVREIHQLRIIEYKKKKTALANLKEEEKKAPKTGEGERSRSPEQYDESVHGNIVWICS